VRFQVHDVNLSSGGPLIVIINKQDASKLDILPLSRLKIKKENNSITVVADIAEDSQIKPGKIGFFEEVLTKLNLKDKDYIDVELEERPKSIDYIKKKLKGSKLSFQEINTIIKDIVQNRLSEIEITYFVSACYTNKLTLDESVSLTKAIVANGNQLHLNKKIVVDKHSVSGVPGNRTTMIVVPILAAAGLVVPKTSSRAISSASGTADTMEVLAPVNLTIKQIKNVVEKTNACMVWGGALELASADDKIIKIERPLSLDPEGILLSSILAKKKAVNATHVLIDIPYGKEAKIESKTRALNLKKKFMAVSKKIGLKVKVVLTKTNQNIGNGIGPALEARDVMNVLAGKGPQDLRKKSLFLANEILKMVGQKPIATQLLDSGKALGKMLEIIKAQGGEINYNIELAQYKINIKSHKPGKIVSISNNAIAHLARIAGAPEDKQAGLYIYVNLKDKVKKGQLLFTIYTSNLEKLNFIKESLKDLEVMKISQ